MEAIQESIIGVVRYYFTSRVETGDRILDGHLVMAGNILITFVTAAIFLYLKSFGEYLTEKCKKKEPVIGEEDDTGIVHVKTEITQPISVFSKKQYKEYSKILKNNKSVYTWSKSDKLHTKMCNYIVSAIGAHGGMTPNRDLSTGLVSEENNSVNDYAMHLLSSSEKVPIYASASGIVGAYKGSNNIYLTSTSNDCYLEFIKYFNILDVKAKKENQGLYEWATGSKELLLSSIYPDRNFDTYVSKYKQTVMNHLNLVLENVKHGKCGLLGSYNLGILLYGTPGTGKTSMIKNICNYTGRDGLIVYPKRLKTVDDFRSLFKKDMVKRWVYILEEIDLIAGVLSGKNTEDTQKTESKKDELRKQRFELMGKLLEEKAEEKVQKMIDVVDKQIEDLDNLLCLDTVLTELDGINEMRGRIMIATTNRPEELNFRLRRPGRFDLQINLDKFTAEETIELLSLIYGTELVIPAEREFASGKYTPVEITNMCREYTAEQAVHKFSVATGEVAIDINE